MNYNKYHVVWEDDGRTERKKFDRKEMAREWVTVEGLDDAVTPLGELRTLPSHWSESGGLDGFYAARLRRRV